MYKEEKSAQIAAFFVEREGGKIPHLKLIKLMYIADRMSMEKTGFPMTYDRMKSLPHGPILDQTLNFIDSKPTPMPESWAKFLEKECRHTLTLHEEMEFSSLSLNDIDILNDVYDTYGHLGKYALRDLTHDPLHFPEWRDPNGSSLPIHYEDIFLAVGDSNELASAKAEQIRTIEAIDNIFDSL